MVNNFIIGAFIKEQIARLNLTQKALANMLNVTPQAVGQWVNGVTRPQEEFREKMEDIFGVPFPKEERNNMKLKVKPLEEIHTLTEFDDAVEAITKHLEYDAYSVTLKRLILYLLSLATAYECYYIHFCKKWDFEKNVTWSSISSCLRTLLSSDIAPIPEDCTYPFEKNLMFNQKLEYISYMINGELVEDLDDEKYCRKEGFVQDLGEYGMWAGYTLCDVLPDEENSLITIFKVTVLQLIDVLDEIA